MSGELGLYLAIDPIILRPFVARRGSGHTHDAVVLLTRFNSHSLILPDLLGHLPEDEVVAV